MSVRPVSLIRAGAAVFGHRLKRVAFRCVGLQPCFFAHSGGVRRSGGTPFALRYGGAHLLVVDVRVIILALAAEATNCQGEKDVLNISRNVLRRFRCRGSRAPGHIGLGEAGQALVEVAIALPILLALLVGIFEFARAYNVQQVITNAAREGARQGVLPTMAEADAVVRANERLADAGITTATVSWVCAAPCETGESVGVTVAVDYTFVFIGPVLSLLASGDHDPGTIRLQSTSTMRKE